MQYKVTKKQGLWCVVLVETKKGGSGAEEVVQSMKFLPPKHGDLSSIPSISILKARHGGMFLHSQCWGGRSGASLGLHGNPVGP